MADDVGELRTQLGIDGDGDGALDDGGERDIGERNSLGDKESACRKVLLNGLERADLAVDKCLVELCT